MFLAKIHSGGRAAADLAALSCSPLPLVLYGAGWYAPYVRAYLARRGLSVAAGFADDGFTAGAGTVTFAEIRRRYEKFNIVIGFADSRLAREKLAQRACPQVAGVYFFDAVGALLNYEIDRAYVERHAPQFAEAHAMFADDLSRETYLAFLNSKLGGAEDLLYGVCRKDQYFPRDLITLSPGEVFVDGGAYTGDTLLAFMRKTGGRYARYYAFEPQPVHAARLGALAARRGWPGVRLLRQGLWSTAGAQRFAAADGPSISAISETGAEAVETAAIDAACPDATFIKLDVEGAELEALKGAAETIRRNRPKLAVCLYHKPGDLFEIPLFLKSLAPDYKFYLRQHQPVACELVLYAVH